MKRGTASISRTIAVVVAVVVIVAGAGAAYFTVLQPRPLEKLALKVGVSVATSSQYVPIFFAKEKNFWAEQALVVEIVPTPGDAAFTQAMLNKDILIGQTNVLAVFRARSQGVPVKIVAQVTEINDFVLITRKDAPFRTGKDLDGQKIGVTAPGSLTFVLASNLGKQLGIKVTPTPLGAFTAQTAALAKGDIAAFVWTWDGAFNLIDKDAGRVLLSFSELYPTWGAGQIIAAHEDLIRQNPDAIRRVLRTIFRTIDFMSKNPAEATTFTQSYLSLTQVSADKAWKDQNYRRDGAINEAAVSLGRELLISSGLIPNPPPVAEVVTKEFTPVRL